MIKNCLKKIRVSLILILFFITSNPNQSFANEIFEIKADMVKYEDNGKVIIATGNATAFDNFDRIINANKIFYFKNESLIKTEGNSNYTDGKNRLQAKYFFYDLKQKIIKANENVILIDREKNKFYFESLVYNEILQIGEGEKIKVKMKDGSYLESANGNFNNKTNIFYLNNGNFTSCSEIYKNKKFCPSWSLKSKKIIHDKNNKLIKHKHAFLKLANIPVFYSPYVSHPDPSVKRKNGFLPPMIKTLTNIGKTIKVPYFLVLDQDKDITITPVFYSDEYNLIQTSYRQALKNGKLNIENGYSKGYQNLKKKGRTNGSRNYIFIDYEKNYDNLFFKESLINFKLQRVSQQNFIRVNKINTPLFNENLRNLENSLKFVANDNNKKLEVKVGVFENIDNNDNEKYTYYLPDGIFSYNTSKFKNFNTNFNSYFTAQKFLDNQKQIKIKNNISLVGNGYIFRNNGISSTMKLNIYNNNIYNEKVTNDKNNLNLDNYFSIAADNNLPFVKFYKNTFQSFTPRVFLKYTSGTMQNASLNNKTLNYSDVFSMNRTNNLDKPEVGLSLGYGVEYLRNKKRLKTFENIYKLNFGIGHIQKNNYQQNMPAISSLNNSSSDITGFLKYDFFGKKNKFKTKNLDKINTIKKFQQNSLSLNYNFNIENDFSELNKNIFEVSGAYKKIYSSLNFENKENHVGNSKKGGITIQKLINDNLFIKFEAIKNLKTNSSEYNNFGFIFENDCLISSLMLTRDFYSDKDIRSSKTLIFNIVLKPFSDNFAPDLSGFIN